MDPATKILDPDANPRPFSFPNGSLKRHHRGLSSPAEAATAADFLYRECLKNHAASLGGHALDGCGEFMPSPTANPADPTSLKCAACGCHRNFHRRLPEPLLLLHHQSDNGTGHQEGKGDKTGCLDEDNDGRDDEEDGKAVGGRRGRSSASPPPYFSSAPHMLLALSSGLPGAPSPGRPVEAPQAAAAASSKVAVLPRKRFRTKFSSEQKERMHELSEKLGWRMQKRDEGLVEELCREIGIGKGVFKVWMHNNKHIFLGSARRGQPETRNGGGGGGGGRGGGDSGGIEGSGDGSGGGGDSGGIEGSGGGGDSGGIEGSGDGSGGGGNSHVVNGSSPSS